MNNLQLTLMFCGIRIFCFLWSTDSEQYNKSSCDIVWKGIDQTQLDENMHCTCFDRDNVFQVFFVLFCYVLQSFVLMALFTNQ